MVRVPGPGDVVRFTPTPQVAGATTPARIDPRRGSAAGAALARAGNAISSVGSHLTELAEKRQRAEDTLAIAERRNLINTSFNDLDKTLVSRSGEEGFNPDEFTRTGLAQIQKSALDGLSPNARRRFEPELIQTVTQKGIRLGNAEHQRSVARGLVRLDASIDVRVNELIEDPTLLPERLAQTNQELDELHAAGLLTADQLKARRTTAGNKLRSAALRKVIADDPSEASRTLNSGFKPAPGVKGDIQSAIASQFQKAGLSSLLGLVIVDIETGGTFSPTIRPRGKGGKLLSSARGLFQFIDSTGKSYGLDNKASAADQIRAGVKFTQDNVNHLKTVLGRDPELVEIYFAHFLGRGGATALLKARPGTTMSSVLPGWAQIAKANRLPVGMTVRDFIGKFERRVEASAKKFDPSFEGSDSALSRLGAIGITKSDLLRLPPGEFGRLVRQADAGLNADLSDKINDANAMLLTLGTQDVITDRDRADIIRLRGPEQADKIFRDFETKAQRFSDKQQLSKLTASERAAFVNDLKPGADDGGEGFAAKFERFQNAAKAAQEIDEDLNKDSFAFVATNTEEGRQALSTFNTAPSGAAGLTRREASVDSLLNEQRRLGVPEANAKVLSVRLAERFVAQLNGLTNRAQAQAFLAQLQQTYGRHFPRIFQELVRQGADPRIIAIQSTLNGQVATELIETIAVERSSKEGPKFFKERAGDAGKDIEAEVNKGLKDFLRVLPARDVLVAQGYQNAVRALALKWIAERGMTAEAAVGEAVDRLVNDRIEIVGRVGFYKDDPDQAEKISKVLNNFSVIIRAMQSRIDTSNVRSSLGVAEADRRNQYIRSIREQGEFVNSADGRGINVLDGRGALVIDNETGKAVTITWEQLENIGARLEAPSGRGRGTTLGPDPNQLEPDQIDPERVDTTPQPQTPLSLGGRTRRGRRRSTEDEPVPGTEGIPQTAPSPEDLERSNRRRIR